MVWDTHAAEYNQVYTNLISSAREPLEPHRSSRVQKVSKKPIQTKIKLQKSSQIRRINTETELEDTNIISSALQFT